MCIRDRGSNGRFPQVSGIRFKFNLKFPVGSRVSDVEVFNGTSYEPIEPCLLYTSDAADERSSVDLGGRRIIKKNNKKKKIKIT